MLAFWATSAYYLLILSFSPTRSPRYFSTRLLSKFFLQSVPVSGIAPTQQQSLILGFVEPHYIYFLLFSLQRQFWMASFPSAVSIAQLRLVWSAYFLSVYSKSGSYFLLRFWYYYKFESVFQKKKIFLAQQRVISELYQMIKDYCCFFFTGVCQDTLNDHLWGIGSLADSELLIS